MDPQQELFTELLVQIKAKGKEKGYEVYDDGLPPDGTPYPFVYIADFRQRDTDTKTQVIGSVYPTIHVWHGCAKQRGTVSSILMDIKGICRNIRRTNSYGWLVRNIEQNIINDNSTKRTLLHGILTMEFKFS